MSSSKRGPKPIPADKRRVQYTCKLPPRVVKYLRAQDNGTAAVETAVTKSKGYREWAELNTDTAD